MLNLHKEIHQEIVIYYKYLFKYEITIEYKYFISKSDYENYLNGIWEDFNKKLF